MAEPAITNNTPGLSESIVGLLQFGGVELTDFEDLIVGDELPRARAWIHKTRRYGFGVGIYCDGGTCVFSGLVRTFVRFVYWALVRVAITIPITIPITFSVSIGIGIGIGIRIGIRIGIGIGIGVGIRSRIA
jgi:hypothetical protein